MTNKDLIDLSLIKNQNELAIKIANFFTKEEFKYIDLTKLHKNSNRDIEVIEYIYYDKTLESGKRLKLIDMLLLDVYPVSRYIIIRLTDGGEQIDFKCKYSKNMVKLLNSLFTRAYNYKFWSSPEDENIIKSKIIKNYSLKLKSILTSEELEEVKFIINYLIDGKAIEKNKDFKYDFALDNYEFIIESNDAGLIRFSYKDKKELNYNSIYFTKVDTGLSNINLIIEQALNP